MYVDKALSGITAAFEDYYRTTILSDKTDPNKLHAFKDALDGHQVYTPQQIDEFVTRYLDGADRETLISRMILNLATVAIVGR